MYVVEVFRGGDWTIVGQYATRAQANAIATDYHSRGEKVRIVTE